MDHRSRDELLAEGALHGWRHHPSTELESDQQIGGCAFIDQHGHIEIRYYNGDWGSHALSDARPAPEDVIREELTERRHIYRDLTLEELGLWQRAAVNAARAQCTVAELGLDLSPADLDYAEYLCIQVRVGDDPMRALAASDPLLQPPKDRRYTHPCPLCKNPTVHSDRYPNSVCIACGRRAVDSTGREITGHNTSWSGGFHAVFTDTKQVCDEVTHSNRCWIGGRLCSIDEARFGGIVIEALP